MDADAPGSFDPHMGDPNFQTSSVHDVDQRCVKAAVKIVAVHNFNRGLHTALVDVVDWVKAQREADEFHAAA